MNKNNIDNNYEVLKEVKSIELNEDNEEYNKCKDERKQNKKKFFLLKKNINMEEKLMKIKSMEKGVSIQKMMKII